MALKRKHMTSEKQRERVLLAAVIERAGRGARWGTPHLSDVGFFFVFAKIFNDARAAAGFPGDTGIATV